MSIEQNKAKVRRFFDEACNEGKHNVIKDVFADEFNSNGKIWTSDIVKERLEEMKDCFQNLKVNINKQIAEENWVSIWRTWKGVQIKEYNHHPITNKLMTWMEISVVRLENEKIVEDWVFQSDIFPAE